MVRYKYELTGNSYYFGWMSRMFFSDIDLSSFARVIPPSEIEEFKRGYTDSSNVADDSMVSYLKIMLTKGLVHISASLMADRPQNPQ